MSRGVAEKDTPCSVGRISRRRNPPTAAPEQPSGGLRFANPPYALLPKSRLASLTPGYVPPVEVLPDPNFKNRHIASTQVEVGDVVNVSPALNALQTDHPNGRKIQGLRETPRDTVRMPLTRSSIQKHDERFPAPIRLATLALMIHLL